MLPKAPGRFQGPRDALGVRGASHLVKLSLPDIFLCHFTTFYVGFKRPYLVLVKSSIGFFFDDSMTTFGSTSNYTV